MVPGAVGQQASAPAEAGKATIYRPADPLNNSAFDRFYNMDYDRSVQDFQKILDRHPDDPFAINHLLTAVMFRELYRMGALNTGDYANDSFIGTPHHPADAKAKAQITELVDRAEKVEEEKLKANPKDVDALYARGNTRAQFSTYTALVERAWFSALRNAVGARHDHERVLELVPAIYRRETGGRRPQLCDGKSALGRQGGGVAGWPERQQRKRNRIFVRGRAGQY